MTDDVKAKAKSLQQHMGNPMVWAVGIGQDCLLVYAMHKNPATVSWEVVPNTWEGVKVRPVYMGPLSPIGGQS